MTGPTTDSMRASRSTRGAVDPDAVGASTAPVISKWTAKDTLLYALGVGAGSDDPALELAFTTENSEGAPHRVLPTFAVVPTFPCFAGGAALDQVGDFDRGKAVHALQTVELHAPIPSEGEVSTVATIVGVWDKGSGALVEAELVSRDVEAGTPLFTQRNAIFIRGEGGWGGDRGPASPVGVPDGPPDHVADMTTRPDQALLYRLSGDVNPLHSDPVYARRFGLDSPILHGLCTYGFTCRALLHAVCESDPSRFVSMSGRFTSPVVPGDALTVQMWLTEPGVARYRTVNQHGDVVIDAGRLEHTL